MGIDPVEGREITLPAPFFFPWLLLWAKDGEVMVGVNHDPLNKEMFHAAHGMGAYLNEEGLKFLQGTLEGA
ncbi:MAG: hypothetical protein CM1200mP3_05100 [Chloroflexota bacterium]|nr:MAG: hypothetical protein CM1200mP3_05100 [Chloroflexota bacterium]